MAKTTEKQEKTKKYQRNTTPSNYLVKLLEDIRRSNSLPYLTKKQQSEVIELTESTTESLDRICKAIGIKRSQHIRTKRDNAQYREQYHSAKNFQQDLFVEEMKTQVEACECSILDPGIDAKTKNALVQVYKLRNDTTKWVASKLKPKAYGDKLDVNHSGDITANIIRLPAKKLKTPPPKRKPGRPRKTTK